MTSEVNSALDVQRAEDHWVIRFSAMASPCEVLLSCGTRAEASSLAEAALAETIRIEQKFSRYRGDNIICRINNSCGQVVAIDQETADLLRYAAHCHALSEGQFDITSGVLRKAWKFDGAEFTPDATVIESLLELVGWEKSRLTKTGFRLRPGMEIDLGGIGKEYAVDRVAGILFEQSPHPLMVNFGGDIRAIAPERSAVRWQVGIEDPKAPGSSMGVVELTNSALATSGSTYRYCLVNGKRLGHILDPRTGWPVEESPQSITVLADYCTEAGLLSTMAMLKGAGAERFLTGQGIEFHCCR